MGLREQAALDCIAILNDEDGFAFPITVTDPGGLSATLNGFSNDIAETIDPETGMAVSGRVASVALHMRDLAAAGFGIPQGITDESILPWVITFDDILGLSHTFKVQESNPDRAIGVVTCTLETYNPVPVVPGGVLAGGVQVQAGGVNVTAGIP